MQQIVSEINITRLQLIYSWGNFKTAEKIVVYENMSKELFTLERLLVRNIKHFDQTKIDTLYLFLQRIKIYISDLKSQEQPIQPKVNESTPLA